MFPFEQFSFEMLVVLALGLMVLGPKDLPIVLRRIGQFVAKMRGMAAEFRASFDELARQSELDELRKEVDALRAGVHETPLIGSPATAGSVAAAPAYDYKPFDEASIGVDGQGFGLPAEAMAQTAVEPVAAAPVKPGRKRRPALAASAAPAPLEGAAPAAAKPVRTSSGRPRAKAAAKTAKAVVDTAPAKAAPKARARKSPAKPALEIVAKDAAE